MNICFNAHRINLGNTGGCRTIVKSAQILREMGHEVTIVCRKNRYTWEKVKTIDFIPKSDVCIAISLMDIESTLDSKSDKKLYWCRGPEWKWMTGKAEGIEIIKGIDTICNSSWLVRKLGKYGIKSQLCYSGLDLNLWKDMGARKSIQFGTLYSKRKTKKYKFAKKIEMDYKLLPMAKDGWLTEPELLKFYNSTSCWLSPSILEGFHNPPAEALLCGNLVFARDKAAGGTSDYIIHEQTGLRFSDKQHASELIELYAGTDAGSVMVKNGKELLMDKIGSRKANMAKLVEML